MSDAGIVDLLGGTSLGWSPIASMCGFRILEMG